MKKLFVAAIAILIAFQSNFSHAKDLLDLIDPNNGDFIAITVNKVLLKNNTLDLKKSTVKFELYKRVNGTNVKISTLGSATNPNYTLTELYFKRIGQKLVGGAKCTVGGLVIVGTAAVGSVVFCFTGVATLIAGSVAEGISVGLVVAGTTGVALVTETSLLAAANPFKNFETGEMLNESDVFDNDRNQNNLIEYSVKLNEVLNSIH